MSTCRWTTTRTSPTRTHRSPRRSEFGGGFVVPTPERTPRRATRHHLSAVLPLLGPSPRTGAENGSGGRTDAPRARNPPWPTAWAAAGASGWAKAAGSGRGGVAGAERPSGGPGVGLVAVPPPSRMRARTAIAPPAAAEGEQLLPRCGPAVGALRSARVRRGRSVRLLLVVETEQRLGPNGSRRRRQQPPPFRAGGADRHSSGARNRRPRGRRRNRRCRSGNRRRPGPGSSFVN